MRSLKAGIGGGLVAALAVTGAMAGCQQHSSSIPRKIMEAGSVALSPDGTKIYVADQDNGGLAVVNPNAASGHLDFVKTGDRPERVIVRGANMFVSNRFSRTVTQLDASTHQVIRQIAVGAEPMGMDVSEDGKTLYVSHATGQAVHAIDTSNGQLKWTYDAGDEVRAVTVLPDGRLYVPTYKTGSLHIVDGKTGSKLKMLTVKQPPQDSWRGPVERSPVDIEDLVVGVDGRVYIPHSQSNDNQLQPIVQRYYIDPSNFTVSPGYTTVDVATDTLLTEPTDGQPAPFPPTMVASTTAYAGPKVAIIDPSGHYLYSVNYLSSNIALVALDRNVGPGSTQLGNSLGAYSPGGQGVQAVVNVGNGPNGIAISSDQRSAFVYNSFDHTISVIAGDDSGLVVSRTIEGITDINLPKNIQNGRVLFHSASDPRTTDPTTGGVACASCHPNGREDGHTWQFAEGERNTPSLVGKSLKDTKPYHWDGAFTEFDGLEHVLQQRMGGSGITKEDFQDILDYLDSEPAPDNPNRATDGTLTELQKQGEELFKGKAACASCHTGEAKTDNQFWDVGTQFSTIPLSKLELGAGSWQPSDRQPTPPNTPSLRGIFATAPYLHDGSMATLEARIRNNPGEKHGLTRNLTDDEVKALAAYLRAI